jgi:hypothetical protein
MPTGQLTTKRWSNLMPHLRPNDSCNRRGYLDHFCRHFPITSIAPFPVAGRQIRLFAALCDTVKLGRCQQCVKLLEQLLETIKRPVEIGHQLRHFIAVFDQAHSRRVVVELGGIRW